MVLQEADHPGAPITDTADRFVGSRGSIVKGVKWNFGAEGMVDPHKQNQDEGRTEASRPAFRITLFEYTTKSANEHILYSAKECRPFAARAGNTWLHVQGEIDSDSLREVGDIFGLHPLTLEDISSENHRPKVESYGEQLFVIMSLPRLEEDAIRVDQISLFAAKGLIISFHRGLEDPFDPIRSRLRVSGSPLRRHPIGFLLYSLIDVTIDQGFPVLEYIGETSERLEDELLESPNEGSVKRLHEMRRSLLFLRRRLWPQREVINDLIRDEHPLIGSHTKVYLRDCYDHSIHILELIEAYREMSSGMLDIYLSTISYRLNDVMRVLTVIATIFMPLTFIVGVYGMNFGARSPSPYAMPELDWYYGYPLVWLIIISIAFGMLFYFRRKHWL